MHPITRSIGLVAALLSVGCSGGGSHSGATFGGAGAQPTSTSPPAPIPTPDKACRADVRAWSTQRLARETTTISVDLNVLSSGRRYVHAGAGAVLLYGANYSHSLGDGIRKLVKTSPDQGGPIVMTDEEGGGIQRVGRLVGRLPWARKVAAAWPPAQLQTAAAKIARRMRAIGITMNLAPVLDLDAGPGPDETHPDGLRSFSARPAVAARYGLAFAKGMESGGVLPVVKHFPGIGTAKANTDYAPAKLAPLSVLQRRDLVPFKAAIAAQLPAVMVSNAIVPGLTTGPFSLSHRAVTGFLEHSLGFHGLVVTDALAAGSITAAGYKAPDAAVRALRAGADLTLGGNLSTAADTAEFRATIRAITAAVADGSLARQRLIDAAATVRTFAGATSCR